jgi:hypothetical protein
MLIALIAIRLLLRACKVAPSPFPPPPPSISSVFPMRSSRVWDVGLVPRLVLIFCTFCLVGAYVYIVYGIFVQVHFQPAGKKKSINICKRF